MTRKVTLIVPQEKTEQVVARMRRLPGLLTLTLQTAAGLQPQGDLVTAELSEDALHTLIRDLHSQGLGKDERFSLTTSNPDSMVSPSASDATSRDAHTATWEEMATSIARESNMSASSLVLMAIAGALAAAGIVGGALHLAIAGMVIAPGFEPFTRIALGLVNRNDEWRQGLLQSLKGYGVLVLGALAATLMLSPDMPNPGRPPGAYLLPEALLGHWRTITANGLVVSLLGGIGGAVVVATGRSVLTLGAMIALALIPSAALVGVGIGSGDLALAVQGLVRWAVDVALVTSASWVVLEINRKYAQKRRMSGPMPRPTP